MKKVDVLLIYEHKNRELENCALIAAELERRGLTTKVFYNYTAPIRNNYEAKVIIAPHLYNDLHLEFYTRNKKQSNRNAISMQYEQITPSELEEGYTNPVGQAMRAHHIAWGQYQADRYLRNGINPNNVHDTGCVSMDLYRTEFKSYFLTKEQVAQQFGIDKDKEWVLFISSFVLVDCSKEKVERLRGVIPSIDTHVSLNEESFSQIIKWFGEAAKRFPDKLFIYRKHPSEKLSPRVLKLMETTPNIKCIDSFTIRQWAIVTDKIYNWISTSQADIFFARKSSYVLRPIPIPPEMDVVMFGGGKYVTTYEEFLSSLTKEEYNSPIQEDKMKYYYSNTETGEMAYEKIADVCESLIADPNLGSDFHFKKKNVLSFVKDWYDVCIYQYGKKIKTSEGVIHFLKTIPFCKTLAAKLEMFNQELYGFDKIYSEYYIRFRDLLNSKHSNGK